MQADAAASAEVGTSNDVTGNGLVGAETGTESSFQPGDTAAGVLPQTGAEDSYMGLLAAGGGLLLAGGGLMVYRRRFAEEA